MAAALAAVLAPVRVATRARTDLDAASVVGLVTDNGAAARLQAACAGWPALRFIAYLAHGAGELLEAAIPPPVRLLRLRDPFITRALQEYVTMHLLAFHRDRRAYELQQRRRRWEPRAPVAAEARRVAVLGLGEIGGAIARRIASMGFETRGWSRTGARVPGVRCSHGPLHDVLRAADVIINVLPATGRTRALLGEAEFALLRRGSCVINVGRGATMVHSALLRAVRSGQVAYAALDVTEPEPLPRSNPLWLEPAVVVTPHSAGLTAELSLPALAKLLKAALAGRADRWRVQPNRGY